MENVKLDKLRKIFSYGVKKIIKRGRGGEEFYCMYVCQC